jgi:hypothetical protein
MSIVSREFVDLAKDGVLGPKDAVWRGIFVEK